MSWDVSGCSRIAKASKDSQSKVAFSWCSSQWEMDRPAVLKLQAPTCERCHADIEQLAAVCPLSQHRWCAPQIAYHAATKRPVVDRIGGLAWLHAYLVHICSHIHYMGDYCICIHHHQLLFTKRSESQCQWRRSRIPRDSLALAVANCHRVAPTLTKMRLESTPSHSEKS